MTGLVPRTDAGPASSELPIVSICKPGELVREVRRRKGLTQRDLARRTGTSQAFISRIESDRVSPSFRTVEQLLVAMGEGLRISAEPFGHDRSLLTLTRRYSPDGRVRNLINMAEFAAEFRGAANSRARSRSRAAP